MWRNSRLARLQSVCHAQVLQHTHDDNGRVHCLLKRAYSTLTRQERRWNGALRVYWGPPQILEGRGR